MEKPAPPLDRVDAELLDRVMSNLDVSVEPFTYCVLSSGWCLHLPAPEDVMLHFVLQGQGLVHMQKGGTFPVDRHWLAVVPRGMTHALESVGAARHDRWIDAPESGAAPPDQLVAGTPEEADLVVACGLIHVRYGDSIDLFGHLPRGLAVDLSSQPTVRTAFEGLLEEQSHPGPGSRAMQAALMSQCLVNLLRELSGNPEAGLPWLAALRHPRLTRAMDRIMEDPAARHTVDSLADEACMSRSSFAQRFVDAFGISPMSFVQNVRLRGAARLLENGSASVGEVGRQVGYASRSQFSKAFKKQFGVSPAAFREAGGTG